jgi:methionyl-tRNA formyltransferase
MRYVFFGSPEFASIFLSRVIEAGLPPVAVICNPDRPVGRKQIITAPPIKTLAGKHHIEILQPANKAELTLLSEKISALSADIFVVAAYANIIPESILKLAPKGVVGIHPSLLPLYRGATPIQSVLLAGETKTGTSLYQMDAKVDHGPLIAQGELSIDANETYLSLEAKLAELGADLFINRAKDYVTGGLKPTEQNHAAATLTKKFETKDAEVDFKNDEPLSVYRKIQALNPEPGVYTFSFPGHEGKRVKLLAATFSDGLIHITKIQPDGKKPIELTK